MTAPKKRPILFSGPMVRALLDGRKTQTRRIVKPQPDSVKNFGPLTPYRVVAPPVEMPSARCEEPIRCPYGVPGDRLWVKEGWRYINHQTGPRGLEVCIGYEADGDDLPHRPSLLTGPGWEERVDHWPFRSRRWPSIHMPRWASRLTLEITEVRVERIQDISEADAIAEGPGFVGKATGEVCESVASHRLGRGPRWKNARDWYADLWESINGPDSWAANPWVWAVSFRVVERA